MATRTRDARSRAADKAGDIALTARQHPVVQRMIDDPDFRDDVRSAYDSLRLVYQKMSNGKGPYRALTEDKKVQKNLKEAAESLRDASNRLRSRPKRSHFGRKLFVLAAGAALVLVLSEGARQALLDRLFGAEEEFEYSSTTTPA